VGVAGLGIGTLACFGQPGQEFTFYEIDPAIIKVAQDPQLFTYLDDSKATIKVVEGDVLQTLPQTPAAYYDLLVMDAYDGHAPPPALLARPALELYLSRLRPAGVLLIHLTSPRDLTSSLLTAIGPLKTTLLLRQSALGKGKTLWAALCAEPARLESLRLHARPWTTPMTQAPN
jgi:spermidine synthase